MKKIILAVVAVLMASMFAGCNMSTPRYTTGDGRVPYTYNDGAYHDGRYNAGIDGRVSGGGTRNGRTHNGRTHNGRTYNGGYTAGPDGHRNHSIMPRTHTHSSSPGPRAANSPNSATNQTTAPKAS